MTSAPDRCHKCGGEMGHGFIPGNYAHEGRVVGTWAPGEPRRSFWSGTKPPDGPEIPIATFRCASCGFLESYARPEYAAR